MRDEPWAGDATRDRPAWCCCLEDRLARHAGELRAHMADDLEVRRHVLELFRDILADEAKTATARRAAARLAVRVMVVGARLGPVDLRLTRQVGRQLAIDFAGVGRLGLCRLRRRRKFIQWYAFDQSDLRVVKLFAGGSELRANPTQQLQLELVDHQFEQHHFRIAYLYDTQQRIDGVGCAVGVKMPR